jgi:hypothetical protein
MIDYTRAFFTLALASMLAACSSGQGAGSTGNGGSGGGSGNGGSGGASGGTGGSSGSPGTTTIELQIAPGNSYCQTGDCGPVSSIGIEDSNGQSFVLNPGDCYTQCDSCETLPCPGAACQMQGYSVTGQTLVWDGTHFTSDSCGPSSTQCYAHSYAAPGTYTAVMCSTPGALVKDANDVDQCTSSGPVECVEVSFQFPSATPAVGTLPPG